MKIVVLDGYTLNPGDNPWDPLAALGDLTVYDRTNPEDVLERSRGAEILITNKTRLNADTLAALPDLRCIGVIATGYDVVDIAAAGKRGIPVMNVVNYGTEAVAQHAFALLLELCRRTTRASAPGAGPPGRTGVSGIRRRWSFRARLWASSVSGPSGAASPNWRTRSA